MELRWKASFSASCLHAVTCLDEGLPAADLEISALLRPAAAQLQQELHACGLAGAQILPQLTGLSSEIQDNRQLIQLAVTQVLGTNTISEAAVNRLAGRIADLESTLRYHRPQLVNELAIRGRPLREQWETRGPGLLSNVARQTSENFVAPTGEVVLVYPLVGGQGRAHLNNNRVTLEAVLANPHDDLPETVRLGWLLTQLNFDMPMFSDPIPRFHLPIVASLACLPLVLAGAESVEWSTLSRESIARAIECWHLPTDLPADIASRLHNWWQAYAEGETPWSVAIAALDQILHE